MSPAPRSTSKPSRRQKSRKWAGNDLALAHQQITDAIKWVVACSNADFARQQVIAVRKWVAAKLASYSLSTAVVLSLLTFLVAAYLVLDVTYHLNPAAPAGVHRGWLGAEYMSWATRLKYAAAVVTGCGATVALVVNYRKQRDSEQGRFATSFADACAQLGGEAPAVRLGGVYALAALADRQSDRARRQQCIDALCAYLRLPYDPHTGNDHTTTKTTETTPSHGRVKTIVTSSYRPADKEVRLTIIRLIRDHLKDPNIHNTWVGHDFDFTGAVFDGGDFTGAHFTGSASFRQAVFSSGRVSFTGATFSSGWGVSFVDAIFHGGQVSFDLATFSGDHPGILAGIITVGAFDGAIFSGAEVSFFLTTFSVGRVTFDKATFSHGEVSFDDATFSHGRTSFDGATFSGGQVSFKSAKRAWDA